MLEIGRALLLAPELILIDEPSMGLARKVTARRPAAGSQR